MQRSTEALFERYGESYRWLVMAMAMVSTIAAVLSVTIVNVAIPDIMGTFGLDQVGAQWLSTGYLAAMTSTMLLLDFCIKAFGQRATMVVMLSAFLGGALLGGLASSAEMMTLARLIQGAASGLIQPMGMIAVYQVFPPERRGTAMGIYGVGVVMAPAVGPLFGGLLVDALGWRSVFFVGVPFATVAIVLTLLFMPARQGNNERPRFDWFGFVLVLGFLACLLTAFADGPRDGWNDTVVILRIAASVLLLVAFIWWEGRVAVPLMNLSLYTRPAFAGAALISMVLGMGLFGSTYLIPLFVQTVQDLTPTLSGALLVPAGLSMVVLTPFTGRLADRIDPAWQVGFGLTLFIVSFWLFSFADVRTPLLTLALWIMVSRIGMAFIFPALSAGSVRMLPRELLAQGTSSMNFVRQLGGAFGVNLLAVLLQQKTDSFAGPMVATQSPGNPSTAAYLDAAAELIVPLGLTDQEMQALAMRHLGQALGGQASSLAFSVTFQVSAAAFAVSLVGAALMLHGRSERREAMARMRAARVSTR
jgi:MFS transporter, DHA2 family, multidrug resistance protein